MKSIRVTLGIILILGAIGLIVLATYIKEWLISSLLVIAAIDLLSTVIFNKPIIKKGPAAKFLYGE